MADPTPKELRLLASNLFVGWEEDLPQVDMTDSQLIQVYPDEVIDLVQLALARGIEIGQQHPQTNTTKEIR